MKQIKNRRAAEALLAAVITARSTSFLFSKICLERMGPFTTLAVRFWLAFLLLVVLFGKKLAGLHPKTLLRGMAMGAAFFAVMGAEMLGLRTTPSSVTALVENTAIVLVPLLERCLFGRRLTATAVAGTGMAFAGVVLLTFQRNNMLADAGFYLCVLAAVLYALSLILTDRLSRQEDPLVLGMLQIGFMALFSTFVAFAAETPALPATGAQWGAVLYLAVVCSGFGFTLQPLAQSGTTAQRTAMFCGISPAVAAGMGVIFLHESIEPAGVLGMALILDSIFLPAATERLRRLWPAKEASC